MIRVINKENSGNEKNKNLSGSLKWG